MANKLQKVFLEIAKESLWWLITGIIAYLILLPITSKVQYKEFVMNMVFLVITMNYFRYAVYLRSIYVLRSKWLRFAIGVFNVNFFVYTLRRFQGFMFIYDSYTIDDLGKPLHALAPETIYPLFRYFYLEITLTISACLVLTAAFTVRLVLTYWSTARLRLNAGSEE